jgi:hypothetical protein
MHEHQPCCCPIDGIVDPMPNSAWSPWLRSVECLKLVCPSLAGLPSPTCANVREIIPSTIPLTGDHIGDSVDLQ